MSSVSFEMYRGDDKKFNLTVTDQDGNPVNITGSTIKMTWRETFTSPIFLQKTFTIVDGPNGKAQVEIAASDTSALEAGTKHEYVFDVQIQKVDGKIETLLYGLFIILPEITY